MTDQRTDTSDVILRELQFHSNVLRDINNRLGIVEKNSALVCDAYRLLTQRIAKLEERCFNCGVQNTPIPKRSCDDNGC